MNENELVKRIAARAGKPRGGAELIAGIGDDCAIWRPASGEDLLFTTDFLIEDVHFTREVYSPRDIGHKALARGLSDIAAMGGRPRFFLLSLALPADCDRRWVDAFYGGLLRLASRFDAALAGGDLASADRVVCDIVVCGAVPRGKALRRDSARAGDAIYVSAPLGRDWRTHRRPMPRVELGLALRGAGATAAMDLTDGLSVDLQRMCSASGVAAELDHVPVRRGATLDGALHGGEDYQLLWTMPDSGEPPPGAILVGRMVAGAPGTVTLNGRLVPPRGWDHFRQSVS